MTRCGGAMFRACARHGHAPPSLRCLSKHRGRNEGSSAPHFDGGRLGNYSGQRSRSFAIPMEWKAAYRCTSNLWRLSCPPAAAVLSVAAASCAPLAELAARERPVELAVELLRLKRFAKELEP